MQSYVQTFRTVRAPFDEICKAGGGDTTNFDKTVLIPSAPRVKNRFNTLQVIIPLSFYFFIVQGWSDEEENGGNFPSLFILSQIISAFFASSLLQKFSATTPPPRTISPLAISVCFLIPWHRISSTSSKNVTMVTAYKHR